MTKDAHSEAPYALPAADMVTTLDAGKAEENWEERVNAASLDDYIPGSPEEKKMLRKIDLRIGERTSAGLVLQTLPRGSGIAYRD